MQVAYDPHVHPMVGHLHKQYRLVAAMSLVVGKLMQIPATRFTAVRHLRILANNKRKESGRLPLGKAPTLVQLLLTVHHEFVGQRSEVLVQRLLAVREIRSSDRVEGSEEVRGRCAERNMPALGVLDQTEREEW